MVRHVLFCIDLLTFERCFWNYITASYALGHGHVEVTLSTKSWCEPGKVINKFDSRTQQLSIESEKIVLSIPYTNSLPQSLDSVEKEKKKLGVTGISVSLITLEQVFLKYAFMIYNT